MQLPKGATIAVADGEKFKLFRNAGDEAGLKLEALSHEAIDTVSSSNGGRQSSSGNPDSGQAGEDGFSAGSVQFLNQEVLGGSIDALVIIAAPRALGEMRKHYHKALSAVLKGEIAKDLTGHPVADVEGAITAA